MGRNTLVRFLAFEEFLDAERVLGALGKRDLAPFYSNIGWTSIDPELMIRMLLTLIVKAQFVYTPT